MRMRKFQTNEKPGTPAPTSLVSFTNAPLEAVKAAFEDERKGAPKAKALQSTWYPPPPPSPAKLAALEAIRESKEADRQAKKEAQRATRKEKRKARDRTEKGKARLARKEKNPTRRARKVEKRTLKRKARKGLPPPPGQGPTKWW